MARARKTPDSAATDRVRLTVRAVAAMGDRRRFRAGLGPFSSEPQVVEVTPDVAAALRADPMLDVSEAKE